MLRKYRRKFVIWEAKIHNVFSIRKYSFGAASVLLGTTILAMGATGVHADEVSTSAATDTPLSASVLTDTAADPATTVDHSEKQVVSVKKKEIPL